MTRNEFLDISNWGDLLSFCNEEGCDYCEDVYDIDSRDEFIIEELRNWDASDWRDIYDYLDSIPRNGLGRQRGIL